MKREEIKGIITNTELDETAKLDGLLALYSKSKQPMLDDKTKLQEQITSLTVQMEELKKSKPKNYDDALAAAEKRAEEAEHEAKAKLEAEYNGKLNDYKKSSMIAQALIKAGARDVAVAQAAIGAGKFEGLTMNEEGTKIEGLADLIEESKKDDSISYVFEQKQQQQRRSQSIGGSQAYSGDDNMYNANGELDSAAVDRRFNEALASMAGNASSNNQSD